VAAPAAEPEEPRAEEFEDELTRRFADEMVGEIDEEEPAEAEAATDTADKVDEGALGAMTASLAPAKEADQPLGDRGERRRKRILIAAVAAAVALVVVSALIIARESMIAAVPASARAYNWLGLSAETLGAGLSIVDVASSRERTEAGEALVVSGAVTNVATEPRPMPMIRIALLDPDEEELQSTVVEPERPELAPGERLEFSARVDKPAATARRIKVTFLARDDKD
jgi:hypothetical protein